MGFFAYLIHTRIRDVTRCLFTLASSQESVFIEAFVASNDGRENNNLVDDTRGCMHRAYIYIYRTAHTYAGRHS